MKPPIEAVLEVEGWMRISCAEWRARLSVDMGDHRAGLGDDAAGRDRLDLVHLRQAEDDAAGERHGLAVIAGAGAARGHRHVHLEAGLEDVDDLGLALRRDDDVGGDLVELALEDRRVPEEVAALLLHDRRIVLDLDVAESGFQTRDIGHDDGPIKSSSSR